ncbi:hypothetical protein [Methylibium sp.]|uniref:hypothetical protein n=1 Tax=Methylibium sp. TaxID=2067992 RepID=UPI002DC0525F|nr:hypothetical protein [Methylibium sp.]
MQSDRDRLFAPSILHYGTFGALLKEETVDRVRSQSSAERWALVLSLPQGSEDDRVAFEALKRAMSELDAHELIERVKAKAAIGRGRHARRR